MILTRRIASSENVTKRAAVGRLLSDQSLRAEQREGLWAGRALHSPSRPQPGRLRNGFASLGRCFSGQSSHRGLAQRSQQTLHGRMLLLAELFGMALRQTADNGDRGELWLGREPDLDIDGVDQLDFFLGKQEHSNREGFPAYVADRLSAVKWRNWKVHFIWQENMYDPPLTLPLPKVINHRSEGRA